jgi:hypothetical protein
MKLSSLAKCVLTIAIGAAMLAACNNNGGSSLAPSGASVGMPGIAHILVRSQPANLKGTGPYQYIANANYGSGAPGTVSVFDYPKSDAQIGSISSLPSPRGFCTNVLFGTGKETFWVVSSSGSSTGALYEFKVGGNRPIKTLTPPSRPAGCAIDPPTGNLVATMLNNGQVVIYKKASGKGTVSQTPLSEAFFAGFDNKSNLYVDGESTNGFGFVELPKGSKAWKTLSVSTAIGFPGEVQFDGKYITITAVEFHDIFGYTCSGTTCTLKRTVPIAGSALCDTWIAKGYVICAQSGSGDDALISKYPAGGLIATLKGSFSQPSGAIQVEK